MRTVLLILLVVAVVAGGVVATWLLVTPEVQVVAPPGEMETEVQMNGKKLTIRAPVVVFGGADRIIVTVKNTGSEPIALAELETVWYYESGEVYTGGSRDIITIKDLSPFELRTLQFDWEGSSWAISLEIKVNTLQ